MSHFHLFLLSPDRPRPTGPFVPSLSLHPSVLIGVALLAGMYLYGITAWRRRRVPEAPLSSWRVVSFFAGLLVLLGSLNGPIHDLSDYYLFSAHMVQHLLLVFVVPPLLLAGIPGWLLGPLFAHRPVRATMRFLTRPVVAGLFFTAMMVLWHLVPLYDLMMRNHDVHIATHLLFIVAATLMWWPVLSPSPEVPRLSPGLQMLYLFLIGIPMQAVAAPISLADTVLYHWYAEAPRTWGLTALQDQQTGGLLMWVPGGLYLGLAIGVIFFQWAAKEK
ncbi:MAG TPA: cytochrome c oxidase assembly protein [Gemmatimonadales bacterium]|nr:cytochrome c oxidase assembly protein [Gemmatimonadales bacterium]